MRRIGTWAALLVVLVTVACSPGEAGEATRGAPTVTLVPVDSTDSVDGEVWIPDDGVEDEWIDPNLIPDLGGTGFQCFGQLPFTDLFVLDERPSLSDEEFASLERITELGEPEQWISFPNGVRMQREPLAESVPRPVLVMPPHATQPVTCTPIWQPSYSSIAFQVVAEPEDGRAVLTIENCWDPESVEVGIRVFDGAAVVWLWSTDSLGPCAVDGSVMLDIDVPPGLDRIHSGQLWPFGPPLLSSWYHYRGAFPDGVEAAERPPIDMTCSVESDPSMIVVGWQNRPWDVTVSIESDDGAFRSGSQAWGALELREAEILRDLWLLRTRLTELGNAADLAIPVPHDAKRNEAGGIGDNSSETGVPRSYTMTATRGTESVTVECGTGAIPTELETPTCTVALQGSTPLLIPSNQAGGVFVRNGIEIDLSPAVTGSVDTSVVPGETYTYDYEMTDTTGRGRSSRSTRCGTVTVPAPDDLVEALTLGAEAFANRPTLPYVYFTIVHDGAVRQLRMEPQDQLITVVDPPDDYAEIDPFSVHQRLLTAIAEGREVDAVVDLVSGLPTEWSIDGERWELSCFSLDNRPPELRDGPCDPVFDLISSN